MGQVLHGSARTTEAVRRAIQHSQESLRTLAGRHGVNPKTIAKWKNRTSVADQRTGPKDPRSTVLSTEEEAIIVAFRRHTLLPLDDCLYALQPTIPHLTRSSLHRCLQRHGISRLPDTDGDKPQRSRFKAYPIGFFHLDIAELRTEQGKLYLLVAIDRTSKFAFVELHEKATRRVAGDFLRRLVAAVPYKINTVLTDNGTHFTDPTGDGWTPEDIRAMRAEKVPFRCHSFEAACADLDIEHRLTKPRHPWTNGQVERMNRTLKDATVKRFHYASHDQLRQHLADFVAAYNFGRRLKTLKGLTPYEFMCKRWTVEPERFTLNPLHQMPGLNISGNRPGLLRGHPPQSAPPHHPCVHDAPFGALPRRRSSDHGHLQHQPDLHIRETGVLTHTGADFIL
jgi:transposase InsO family protein